MNTIFIPMMPTVRSLGLKFFQELDLQSILITVRSPKTGEIAQFHRHNHSSGSQPIAMISQPIHLRGHELGRIELHSSSPALKAVQLMQVAQTLQDELARTLDRAA